MNKNSPRGTRPVKSPEVYLCGLFSNASSVALNQATLVLFLFQFIRQIARNFAPNSPLAYI